MSDAQPDDEVVFGYEGERDITFYADGRTPWPVPTPDRPGPVVIDAPVTALPWFVRSDDSMGGATLADLLDDTRPTRRGRERREPEWRDAAAPGASVELHARSASSELTSTQAAAPSSVAVPSASSAPSPLSGPPAALEAAPVPWFIRVDQPRSLPVGYAAPEQLPAVREGAGQSDASARKRAMSFRRRQRDDVAAADVPAEFVLQQTAVPLSIAVFGCAPSSLALASSLALSGHSVAVIVEDDDTMIALEGREERFLEPNLHRLYSAALTTGGLRFTVDPRAMHSATVSVLLDATDEAAVTALLPSLGLGSLVVVVAPFAAGMRALERRIRTTGAELAWVPLLAREGRVVADMLHPRGLVFGLPRDPLTANDVRGTLADAYAFAVGREPGTGVEVVDVDFATADLARAAGVALLLAALGQPE